MVQVNSPDSASYSAQRDRKRLLSLLRAMRPVQWSKNVLLAVPLLAGHRLDDPVRFVHLLLAMACFSLGASAIYLINDVRDRQADRLHPTKSHRPIATGELAVGTAVGIAAVLLVITLGTSLLLLPSTFVLALACYIVISVLYSMLLKRKAVIDVLVLAGLYTLRIIAGGEAVNVRVSEWLLAFSMFFFLSLAFAKRYSELLMITQASRVPIDNGRGYEAADLPLVLICGLTSGYLSVLILALYISSQTVTVLYRSPQVLWLLCPLMLYWVTRFWLLAVRGRLHDDPVIFALSDRVSWLVLIFNGILVALATVIH